MALNITDNYLPKSSLHRPGTTIKPTKIAVHYTGSPGGKAISVRNYFASTDKYVSSHYVIGLQGEIIRMIPETEISYATNSANSYAISIETCHPDSTGKFNTVTLNSLIALCADICKRRGFNPLTDIIRHYDVTQKCCPRWWSPNGPNSNANSDFVAFKNQVKAAMNGTTTTTVTKAATTTITDASTAIKTLQSVKIINSPDFWYNAIKTINYLDKFLINAANHVYTTKRQDISDINTALTKIKTAGVITGTEYWSNAATTNKYLADLIIAIAKYV